MTASKINEAKEVLAALGLPPAQQRPIAASTLLALADLGPDDRWKKARRHALRIHDIILFIRHRYGKAYAENSRETFRKSVIHQFEQARLIDRNPERPDLPTNSPNTRYALTPEALSVIQAFGSQAFETRRKAFVQSHGTLLEVYLAKRTREMVPVTLPDGTQLVLSPGKHNLLQAAIIKEFAPRFAQGAEVLYFGDTAKKNLHVESEALRALSIPINGHDKLPDVLLHTPKRKLLFLIEAVTSHGPVSPKRKLEIEKALRGCRLTKVFVTAFPDLKVFKRHIADIAWETEVWIAEIPDHLIHFNGDKFLDTTLHASP